MISLRIKAGSQRGHKQHLLNYEAVWSTNFMGGEIVIPLRVAKELEHNCREGLLFTWRREIHPGDKYEGTQIYTCWIKL